MECILTYGFQDFIIIIIIIIVVIVIVVVVTILLLIIITIVTISPLTHHVVHTGVRSAIIVQLLLERGAADDRVSQTPVEPQPTGRHQLPPH